MAVTSICSPEDIYTTNNNFKTVEPFVELRIAREYAKEPTFTLARQPKAGYIPLFQLYMNLAVDDPSEMTFVEHVFGDYAYWMALCDSSGFKPYIEEWRHIATVKRKQKAFLAISQELKTDKPTRFSAAKYLIEEPWKGGPTAADRRKAKAKTQQTTEEAFRDSQVQEDIQRLREQGILQ